MVNEGRHAVAVDYGHSVLHAEQVRHLAVFVAVVALFRRDALAGVFHHLGSGGNWGCGVAADSMNIRGSQYEAHGSFHFHFIRIDVV